VARQFTRGARRKTQWAGFADENGAVNLPPLVALTAGTAAIVSSAFLVSNAVGFFDEEVTITRTIGVISAMMNVDTASLQAEVCLGLFITRSEAIAAGVGSLPDPEDDPDAEWLYHTSFSLRNPNDATRNGPISALHAPFDVKGQRIVRAGSTVVWIAKAITNNVRVAANGRYLVKLP